MMTATHRPSPATSSASALVLTPLQAASLQELGIPRQLLVPYLPATPLPNAPAAASHGQTQAQTPQTRPQSLATLATHLVTNLRQKAAQSPSHPAPPAPERASMPDHTVQQPAGTSAWVLPDWAAQVLAQPDGAFDLMVISEAPGLHDASHAHPASNRMGVLLAAMLKAAGFQAARFASDASPPPPLSHPPILHAPIFHTHLLAMRPLAQHGPSVPELAAGLARLRQQIARLRPRRLLVLGEVAAQALLSIEATDHGLDTLRGQCHPYVQDDLRIPLVATYAPAVLLARPRYKALVWQDLNALAQSEAASSTTTLAAMPSLRPR